MAASAMARCSARACSARARCACAASSLRWGQMKQDANHERLMIANEAPTERCPSRECAYWEEGNRKRGWMEKAATPAPDQLGAELGVGSVEFGGEGHVLANEGRLATGLGLSQRLQLRVRQGMRAKGQLRHEKEAEDGSMERYILGIVSLRDITTCALLGAQKSGGRGVGSVRCRFVCSRLPRK